MYNIGKDLKKHLEGTPPGTRNSAIHWFQKQVAKQSLKLKRDFGSLEEWEKFKVQMKKDLVSTIGFPELPPMKKSWSRGCVRVGEDVLVERVDVYVDDDFGIPAFVFSPAKPSKVKLPAFVWSPGYPQDKWERSYQLFAERMAKKGFVVLVMDHLPFGETAQRDHPTELTMTLVNSAGMVIGISQLAMRAAENIRCKEYLKTRDDVDISKIALGGLCQGGMDTYLTMAVDDEFCAFAPFCSESTYTVHMTEMSSYKVNAETSPFPFGILKVCDVEHLHACAAPRPLLVRSNLPDNWWPISGFDDVEYFTRKIYKLYDAEDKMDFRAEVNFHDLVGPFVEALDDFLLKYVK